jgi:hypothetical protein
MNSEETIKQRLIHRILAIQNQDILEQVEQFISAKQSILNENYAGDELTSEQLEMLRLAEEDIKYGRVISHEDLKKESLKWLESKNRTK